MGTYNSDPNVYTLANSVAENPLVKGKIWNRMLDVGSNTVDDFSHLEGPPESDKPFWKKQDLSKDGGDTIVFSTIGDVGGPGARGEQELTGRTSKPRMGAYQCQVDYWRDAVEVTKKQIKFLAAGRSLESVLLKMLSKKLGRKKMYDMMHALLRTANAVTLRPGYKTSTNAIRHTDVLTPSFLTEAKARIQGVGGRETGVVKSPSGSRVLRYLVFAGQDAMVDIRNSTSYQSALLHAATKGSDKNELFSGKLVDWNALALWEHIVVDPDADDAIGSPLAPKARLGVAVTAADTTFILKSGEDGTNTLPEYFRDFNGFDYLFTEDQTAAPDSNTYYFWIKNLTGADAGKAGFYSYVGTANTGNQITAITGRLRLFTNLTVSSVVAGTYTTSAAHGLAINDTFQLDDVVNGSGNGVTEATTYFVKTVPTSTTITAAATLGGTAFTGSADSAVLIIKSRGLGAAALGEIDAWDADTMTDAHPAGSMIIPANAYGVPICRNFLFGAGAALRAYGSIMADPIYQDRDYKFVKGMGYESIFGQKAALDTQDVPRHYIILETAFEHPGLTVPYKTT
jgi:hypothetical protein